ncbi:hypothetical protein L1049_012772 [Liquidambar formosana]|uniref:LysM domain-containing protein n=1 Tax=Liquidambar formosana TaxID=63359 RepID=A0AAP0WTN2_LIQFO
MDPDNILRVNNLNSSSQILKPGREVLVPINCSCSGQFFQANFSYVVPESTTFSEIACGVFEGKKFSIPPENIWAANCLDRKPTVYPNTTVLVPLQADPVINFNLPDSPPPPPGFLPTSPVEKPKQNSNLRTLYIAVSVVGFSLVLIVLLACGFYVKASKKWKHEKFQSFTGWSSPMSSSMARSTPISGATVRTSSNSCLSPDLLVGIKYSLYNYSIEELRKVTRDFSEDTKIDGYVYKGLIDNVDVMIKQMRFAETRQNTHLITETMIYLGFLIWARIRSSYAQQFYDPTPCSSDTNYPGSRYTCDSFQKSCETFIVYRASQHFQTISNISNLFGMDPDKILNLTSCSQILKPGREVLVPIDCSCSGQFFQANFG